MDSGMWPSFWYASLTALLYNLLDLVFQKHGDGRLTSRHGLSYEAVALNEDVRGLNSGASALRVDRKCILNPAAVGLIIFPCASAVSLVLSAISL